MCLITDNNWKEDDAKVNKKNKIIKVNKKM